MNLMTYCPEAIQSASNAVRWFDPRKLWRRLPSLPALSSPLKMTSAVGDGRDVFFTTGARVGGAFQISRCLTTALAKDGAGFVDNPRKHGIGTNQMCLCLPRRQTISRYVKVPSSDPAELASMVPYQLAVDLPLALEDVCWTSEVVTELDDGFCLVLAQLVRTDQVSRLVQPFQKAGFVVEGLVPEGWAWAHLLHEHLEDSPDPVSALIPHPDGTYLIVAQAGNLLYDTLLNTTNGDSLETAGQKYTEIFGQPLPEPVRWQPPAGDTDQTDRTTAAFFGGSLAAIGCQHRHSLAPDDLRQHNLRRSVRMALRGTAALVLCVLLLCTAVLCGDLWILQQRHDQLTSLQGDDHEEITELAEQYQAIKNNQGYDRDSFEYLHILAALQEAHQSQMKFEQVRYVRDGSVVLRGSAPDGEAVVDLLDDLTQNPLWRNSHIQRMQAVESGRRQATLFTIKADLTN